MPGMEFDAGTWWLVGIIVTALVGIVGFLFGRTVFKQLDKNGADIKEVRENYTPRTQHEGDLKELRREMKEMRTEMKSEINDLADDIKDIKENCMRREEFMNSQHQVEKKLDRLMEYILKGSGRDA